MKFTVVLVADEEDGGFVAECPAIPGCVSEGESVEEALANIKDAIAACLESLSERAHPLPDARAVIVATVEVEVPVLVGA